MFVRIIITAQKQIIIEYTLVAVILLKQQIIIKSLDILVKPDPIAVAATQFTATKSNHNHLSNTQSWAIIVLFLFLIAH